MKSSGSDAGDAFCLRTDRRKKVSHILSLAEGAPVVIAPAERDGPALAREAVKFKFLERKAFDVTQQSLLFLMTEEVGMIIRRYAGKRSSPKRFCVGLTPGTRLFPCPGLRGLAVTPVALTRRSLRLRLPAAILRKGAPNVIALLDPALRVAADIPFVTARCDQFAFCALLFRPRFLRCPFGHHEFPS